MPLREGWRARIKKKGLPAAHHPAVHRDAHRKADDEAGDAVRGRRPHQIGRRRPSSVLGGVTTGLHDGAPEDRRQRQCVRLPHGDEAHIHKVHPQTVAVHEAADEPDGVGQLRRHRPQRIRVEGGRGRRWCRRTSTDDDGVVRRR